MKVAKQVPGKPAEPGLLGTYQQLVEFNQHCVAALDLIQAFGDKQMIQPTEYRYYRALLRELRAATSQSVMERLDEQEISIAAKASKERLKIEKQMFK